MIKNSALLLSLALSTFHTCFGQSPIEWSKSLGSIGEFYAGIEDHEGNLVFAGELDNPDAARYGERDFSILKVNQAGDLIWQQNLGGSGIDVAVSVCESQDKGYVFVGNSGSSDGDIGQNYGIEDLVAAKYSSSGKLLWKFVYGGSGLDNARKIIAASDGGFVIVGTSDSKDKDVSVNYGEEDCWVLKLSAKGKKEWETSIGGSRADKGVCVLQAEDGGFFIGGTSDSRDRNFSGNHTVNLDGPASTKDIFLVKISDKGKLLWTKNYGGTGIDRFSDMAFLNKTSLLILGSSSEFDMDQFQRLDVNVWLAEVALDGTQKWKKTFGNEQDNYGYDLITTSDNHVGIIQVSCAHGDGFDVLNSETHLLKLDDKFDLISEQKIEKAPTTSLGFAISTSGDGFVIPQYVSSRGDEPVFEDLPGLRLVKYGF